MKHATGLMILLFLFAGCGQQPETDPAINIPSSTVNTPDITSGIETANENVCRANMQTVAAGIMMYQAENGSLPEDLDQLSVPAVCPDGGKYLYTVEGSVWQLSCPADPCHGSMVNGTPDW